MGYTATPFANVFIDPDDAEDLFPSDFILSLPKPEGYMGVADFYDLDGNKLEATAWPLEDGVPENKRVKEIYDSKTQSWKPY